jgi:hypothetical protein
MAYDLILRKSRSKNWSRSSSMGSDDFDSGWDEIGIVSSSVARATADQVRADLDGLNIEISSWYQKIASQRKAEHGNFVNSWIKFRDTTYKMLDDSKRFWNPELASSIVTRLNKTQQDIRNWRARWEQISGQKGVSVLSQLPTPPEDKKKASLWPYVVVGLGSVVLVGGVLTYVMFPKMLAAGGAGVALGGLGLAKQGR